MGVIHVLLVWLLVSIILSILPIVLVVFKPKGAIFSEMLPHFTEPQVQLLNHQIKAKSARLEKSAEKISEIKRAISKLEIKRGHIRSEYNKLLKKLKDSLVKTESECKSIYSEIENLTEKRLKMKIQMEKKKSQISLEVSMHSQNSL